MVHFTIIDKIYAPNMREAPQEYSLSQSVLFVSHLNFDYYTKVWTLLRQANILENKHHTQHETN